MTSSANRWLFILVEKMPEEFTREMDF